MAFVATPNAVSVEMRFTQDGQKVENVYHVETDGSDSAATRLAIATAFYNWWTTEMSPIVSTLVLLREIYVVDLSSESGGSTTFVPIVSTTGSNVNEALPNNVTLAVSARTARRGRSFRGRSYVIGLTKNVVANNRYSDAVVSAIQAAYNTLQPDYLEQPVLSVLSTRADGMDRPAGVMTAIQTWVVVDNVVDAQRRRLPGRGQ